MCAGIFLEMSRVLLNAFPVGLQRYFQHIAGTFGVTLDTVGRAMLIGEKVGLFSFLPLWALSVVMMLFVIIVGII